MILGQLFVTKDFFSVEFENYDTGDRFLTLEIPNKEVAYIYRNKIVNWFGEAISKRNWNGFFEALFLD